MKKLVLVAAFAVIGVMMASATPSNPPRDLITVNTSCGKTAYLSAHQIKSTPNAIKQSQLIDKILCG